MQEVSNGSTRFIGPLYGLSLRPAQLVGGTEQVTKMFFRTLQQAKRFLRIILGFTLLALGAVLFFSPAPGWLVMLLGLGLLAAEFVWARRLLASMKEQGIRLRDFVFARSHVQGD
ncbi:MAG TPA: PGPGW domain-containing protein [Candidatus Acidoferrales bacterium]|nr:PGPGW domain-containing protein [Candidatus Acidoferrales bacterium]